MIHWQAFWRGLKDGLGAGPWVRLIAKRLRVSGGNGNG